MTDQQLLERFEEIVAKQLEPVKQALQTDIHSLKKDLKSIKETVEDHTLDLMVIKGVQEEHTKEILKIKRNLRRSNKTLTILTLRYDERIVQNTQDIDQIKLHLHLP